MVRDSMGIIHKLHGNADDTFEVVAKEYVEKLKSNFLYADRVIDFLTNTTICPQKRVKETTEDHARQRKLISPKTSL